MKYDKIIPLSSPLMRSKIKIAMENWGELVFTLSR